MHTLIYLVVGSLHIGALSYEIRIIIEKRSSGSFSKYYFLSQNRNIKKQCHVLEGMVEVSATFGVE
jgi:hypothetical protein